MKNAAGEVVELRCTYDPQTRGGNAPDGRKVQATLHWVSAADAVPAEIRLYNHLFARPDPNAADFAADLNPDSREVLARRGSSRRWQRPTPATWSSSSARAISVSTPTPGPDKLVFNRTVGLRDTWAKVQGGTAVSSTSVSQRSGERLVS